MRKYSNLFKRSQALLLVVAMLFSMLNVGLWLNVSADDSIEKSVGEIVAQNYDLTSGEKALLSSGLLTGGSVTFTAPIDSGLVEVDNATKTIKAQPYQEWNPASADVIVDGSVYETVVLTDGEGNYTYGGKAFSVEVTYELTDEFDVDLQKTLLSAPAMLKQGVANVEDLEDSVLSTLELAMPELATVSNFGYQVGTMTVTVADNVKAAINRLNNQMKANESGKLTMSDMLTAYNASPVKYLLTEGAAMKAELEALTADINAINELLTTLKTFAGAGVLDQTTLNLANALGNVLSTWKAPAEKALADSWAAAAAGTSLVKEDITDEEYVKLAALVNTLTATTAVSEIKNPLVIATAKIQCNMSMFNVAVIVVLNKVTNNVVDEYDTKTVTLTMPEGATADDIRAAVEANVLADAKADWANVLVDGQFNMTETALPAVLNADTDYTVTYSPKEYTVTTKYDDKEVALPYGYLFELPKCEEAGQDYDYQVNGNKVAEGTLYLVSEDLVITREAGKAYTKGDLNQIISDRYFADGGKADSILTSGALTVSDVVVSVRYPDNDNKIVVLNDEKLTVAPYASDYEGLQWVPYSYSVVVDGVAQDAVLLNGATEATIDQTKYDRVEVEYRLALTNVSDEEVLELLNLPKVLADEAADQLAALNRISNYLGDMSQLNRSMLNGLKGTINGDPSISDAMKTYYVEIVDDILKNSIDASGNLKIHSLLTTYVDPNNGGLAFYYTNSAAVIAEINTLSESLSAMLKDAETTAVLEKLLSDFGYASYVDKIKNLESVMAEVKADLKAPNAAIDVSSENLGKLVKALALEEELTSYTDAMDGAYLTAALSVDAPTSKTVTVTVQIDGGKSITVNKTFNRLDEDGNIVTISEEDVQAFIDEINAKIAELGADDKYYTNDLDLSAIEAMAGKTSSELDETVFTYTWTAKTFTVKVQGSDDQTVSIDNLEIVLPASPNAEFRYEYEVDGNAVNAGKYTFSLEELDAIIAADGEYTVKLYVIEVAREELTALVGDLNSAVGSNAIKFALVRNSDGSFSIVMKVDSFSASALMNAAEPIVMSLAGSGYEYIAMNNHKVMYSDDSGLKVSIQGILDAVMDSGVGTDTLINVMDANGNIKQMTLDGDVLTNAVGKLGGKLIETNLQLGDSATDAMDVDFYITIGSAPSALVQVRNLFAGSVGNYVSAVCKDGAAQLDLRLPGKAYEAVLAVLLLTDNVDFSNLNDANAEIAIGYAKSLIDPLFTGNVTTTTLTNTLDMLGFDIDLTAYESLYQKFCEVYNSCTFTYNEKTGTVNGNVIIKELIDRFLAGKENLKSMIAEYETGINFKAQLTVENLGDDYDALYIDLDANDIKNASGTMNTLKAITEMAGLTNDLGDLSDMTGYAIVVLTDDITGDITLNAKTTILDLNGYTVNGSVIANGNVIIVDGAMSAENIGTVTGTVSGNATVIAGKYGSDVSAFIKSGYVQENGVVSNEFYNLIKDADGSITVEVNAGILNTVDLPSLQTMVIDLATELLLNGYTVNKLYIENNMVYDIELADLLGLYVGDNTATNLINSVVYDMVDSEQLANIINMILDDATNFAAIQKAIDADEPILSYEMTTGAWSVVLEHITDGDYLSVSLSSANEKTRDINVVVVGSDEDKQAASELMGALAETTTVDVNVNMTHGLNGKNLVLDWSASANVAFDFSDPDYAIMFCALIADGIGAPANADLVAGIKTFYERGTMADLKAAFDSLTTAQIITALKNFTYNDDFATILENLGIADVVEGSVVELEAVYDTIGKIAAKVVRYLELNGNSRLMESYLVEDYTYGVSKSNIAKSISREIARGYGVTLNAAITEASVTVTMFNEDAVLAPEYVDGTGTPVVSGDKVAGALVDTDKMMIIIDVDPEGITSAEFEAALKLYTTNADWQSFEYKVSADAEYTVLAGTDLICTGFVVKATAHSNYTDAIDTVEYTIVVLGDVNKNGKTEAGDASLVAQNLVNGVELDYLQFLAADINRNNRVDVGDATIIVKKRTYWDSYGSLLVD